MVHLTDAIEYIARTQKIFVRDAVVERCDAALIILPIRQTAGNLAYRHRDRTHRNGSPLMAESTAATPTVATPNIFLEPTGLFD